MRIELDKLRTCIIIHAFVLTLDAFILGLGLFVFLLILVYFPIVVLKGRSIDEKTGTYIFRMLMPFIVTSMSLSYIHLNIKITKKRAVEVAEACKFYQKENDRWPQRIEDLSPNYMRKVPLARYTLLENRFRLIHLDDPTELSLCYPVGFFPHIHCVRIEPCKRLLPVVPTKNSSGIGAEDSAGKPCTEKKRIEAETVRRNAFSITQSTGNRL